MRSTPAICLPNLSLCLLLLLVAIWLGCGEGQEERAAESQEYAKRTTPGYATTGKRREPPVLPFIDVAASAGIDFTHETGAFGDKWMPETMGSGCALFDVDDDGDDDVVLVNSSFWPGHEKDGEAPTSVLYVNDGSGAFRDVTDSSGLDVSVYGMGITVADYDADGDADLYLTTLGPNLLLRQDDIGRFSDLAREAGVAGKLWEDEGGRRHPEWSTSAVWIDADHDGSVDLFVTNYVRWSPENDLYFSFDGRNKSYATPQQYPGSTPRLYRNRGDGTFNETTEEAGVLLTHAKSMGVAVADFGDDGYVDLVVTNDTQPNFLLKNRGDGTFDEVGLVAGIGYDESGRARAGMGVDVASLANDGVREIGIGNFSREALSLYRQTSATADIFLDNAGKSALVAPTLPILTFGLRFVDYDLDGYQDLVLANGHIEPDINVVQKEISYAQPPQLFWNDGAGHLLDATAKAGSVFSQAILGRGLAVGDLEGDGDPDILISTNGGKARLMENSAISVSGASGGTVLVFRVEGAAPNTDGLHTSISVHVGEDTQVRSVRTGSSYLSQSSMELIFGLGDASRVDSVLVQWPDGIVENLGVLETNQRVGLREGEGIVALMPLATH
ncbi:MAG: CRTAC1 family protein [Candidatus Latescibacterota bacterium]|nr:CRTAC1 family protein [Candidatus Latescibacterota bacterium]